MFGISTMYLLAFFIVILTMYYFYLASNFDYWAKRNVPFVKPVVFFGNLKDRILMKISFHDFTIDLYNQLKSHRFAGIFDGRQPRLLILDPELIKNVLIRDFDNFSDRGSEVIRTAGYINKMLLFIRGAHWKKVRSLLTPTFTSGKLKAMDNLLIECAQQMSDNLNQRTDPMEEIELKEFFGRFTLDVIATCAFGIQCNSMRDADSEFVKRVSKFDQMSTITRIKLFGSILFVPVALRKHIKLWIFNKESAECMAEAVRSTYQHRLKNNERRNDFLQIMIDIALKEAAENPDKQIMDEDTIISQSILFMIAGFETSSSVLSFAAYELALNPDVQHTLRSEITTVLKKYNNICTYDALHEMEYLEMVLLETLRKHSPVARIDRYCTNDYQIEGTDVVIEKGINVSCLMIGLHYDPMYFPEPDKFDPTRFSANKNPTGFFPFGMGPRNCIGKRFAMMSTKLAMVYLIKEFECVQTEKTLVPYKKKRTGILLKADGGILVRLSKIAQA